MVRNNLKFDSENRILSFTNEVDEMIFIPEEIFTDEERQLAGAYMEEHKDDDIEIIYNIESINTQVINKIREKYSVDSEFKMINLGISDPTNVNYIAYRSYVDECIAWGDSEKQKYNLE